MVFQEFEDFSLQVVLSTYSITAMHNIRLFRQQRVSQFV
jgi:hypothetical protein